MSISSIARENLTHSLALGELSGIEIGPLVDPVVTKQQSQVFYVDRASTEELKKWYANDPSINIEDIPNIDYVWGENSLSESIGASDKFDYCIASHVIEHIPDLITWLSEIASILKPGGLACFAVPDRRYTFDYLRTETTISELIENHLLRLRKPSIKQIYDHFAHHAELDINAAWSPQYDGAGLVRSSSPEYVLEVCKDALETGKYVDSHCSVFTIQSFFNLFKDISELGLLDFRIKQVFPVVPGALEFFVQLEKIDSERPIDEKKQLFKESFEEFKDVITLPPRALTQQQDEASQDPPSIEANQLALHRRVVRKVLRMLRP